MEFEIKAVRGNSIVGRRVRIFLIRCAYKCVVKHGHGLALGTHGGGVQETAARCRAKKNKRKRMCFKKQRWNVKADGMSYV